MAPPGMPNFTSSALRSDLTASPPRHSPHKALYGLARDGVHIDAIPLKYDHAAFLDRFLARWPEGSPTHDSYYRRIADGPDYAVAQAAGR